MSTPPPSANSDEPVIRELALSRTPWYGATLAPNGELVALAIASSGDTFAVGSVVTPGHGRDFLVVQQSGSTVTTKVWDSAAHKEDRARAVALRADGSLYVTGLSKGADGHYDIALVKYGPAGDQQWVKRFGPSGQNDIASAVKIRGSALYVSGYADRPGHREDAVLLKFDVTTGKRVWVRYFDDSRHLNDYALGMAVTSSGIYLAGGGRNSDVGAGDALLLRYLSNGTLKWTRYTAGAPGMPDDWTALAAAPDGSIVTTGYVWRKTTGDDIATARYTSAGERSWERLFSSSGLQLDVGQALAIDKTTGDIYVGGTISSTATNEDMGAVAYTPTGTRLWYARRDGGGAGNDWADGCAVSGDSVYLVGGTANASSGSDFAVAQFFK